MARNPNESSVLNDQSPIQLGCENTATVDGRNLHHLGCIKGSMEKWDTYHINWLAGFLPSNSSNSSKGKLRFTIYMQGSREKLATILVVTGTGNIPRKTLLWWVYLILKRKLQLSNCQELHSTPPQTNIQKSAPPQMFCMHEKNMWQCQIGSFASTKIREKESQSCAEFFPFAREQFKNFSALPRVVQGSFQWFKGITFKAGA